jgi:hypothetical protein
MPICHFGPRLYSFRRIRGVALEVQAALQGCNLQTMAGLHRLQGKLESMGPFTQGTKFDGSMAEALIPAQRLDLERIPLDLVSSRY